MNGLTRRQASVEASGSIEAGAAVGGRDRAGDTAGAGRFTNATTAQFAAVGLALLAAAALLAPLMAPQDPFDPQGLDLMASLLPPAWLEGGEWRHPLGTDEQGRDLLWATLFGLRSSLLIGIASVGLALVLGVGLGLVAGYAGGWIDHLLMRAADVQLTFPAILTALLLDGVAAALIGPGAQNHASASAAALILAVGLAFWVQYARTVRALTRLEAGKDYVAAARLVGRTAPAILVCHILPNVLGPLSVLATLNLGLAITTEATLSFVGVGLPPTQPSLGTLIRLGADFLYSGAWWLTAVPAATLAALVLGVTLMGDRLNEGRSP